MTTLTNAGANVQLNELNACRTLHAAYVERCSQLEQAETVSTSEAHLKLARRSATSSRRAWLASVRMIITKPSNKSVDIWAKAQILLETLQELCSADDEVTRLAIAFAEDVERLLREGRHDA